MAEYPEMSTSQGTYVRIEQTSEAIRVAYEMCRAGGARGLELRTADLPNRVWLQTALAFSALAFSALVRSDTSASASDVTCGLLHFLFCSIY